jgi:hypothetical protein
VFGFHCIEPSVCFENAFNTGSKYDVTVSFFPRGDLNQIPIRGYTFFCQMYPSQWSCQMRRVWNSSSYHGLCPPKKIEIEQFFFWTVGRLVTVTQVREVYRVLGQGDIRFLFC